MPKEITVIIPVYNDPLGLGQTLDSLINQTNPSVDFEIIIVDNGSTDNSPDVANSYFEEYPELIKCAFENNFRRSYSARNKGLEISSSPLICFIDANVEVEKDFFIKVINRFNDNSVDYLGVNVNIIISKDTLTARFNSINGFQIESDIKYNHYTPTCCLVVRKKVIDKIGYFDMRLESGGDWDFGQRVYKFGFNQKYDDQIIVYHPARTSYVSLIKKGKRVARGVAQLSHFNPEEHGHLFRSHFNFRRYLPLNPFKLYIRYKTKFNDTTFYQALLLSIYHLPIRIICLKELIKEKLILTISSMKLRDV